MPRRVLALAIVVIAVAAAVGTGYVYVRPLFSASGVKPSVTIVHIPKGSSIQPNGFNVVNFQQNFPTGNYPYPVNIRVTIGVNDTIEWINDDTGGIGHTVTALVAPSDALKFNSGLIEGGKAFSVTLTAPGTYRYTCVWHNWLAGQITVASA